MFLLAHIQMQGTDVLFTMTVGMWMANKFHYVCLCGFYMTKIILVLLCILRSEHLNIDAKNWNHKRNLLI